MSCQSIPCELASLLRRSIWSPIRRCRRCLECLGCLRGDYRSTAADGKRVADNAFTGSARYLLATFSTLLPLVPAGWLAVTLRGVQGPTNCFTRARELTRRASCALCPGGGELGKGSSTACPYNVSVVECEKCVSYKNHVCSLHMLVNRTPS